MAEVAPLIKPPIVGVFIRDHLRERGSAYASEIHRTYKELRKEYRALSKRRARAGTYNSFASYMSKLILAGLVEKTGKHEESNHRLAEALEYPERVYLRLTDKGRRAPDYVWLHPLRLWYRPYDWERIDYREFIKDRRGEFTRNI